MVVLVSFVALATPAMMLAQRHHVAGRADAAPATHGDAAWPTPPLLASTSKHPGTVEFTLTASAARIAFRPGVMTDAYAYNGSVPGPTIDVHEGDRVVIHFHNDLPEATTIHWHGLHIPADMDGSPLRPVQPGASYDYRFTMKPGSAGTYWYHPHPDYRTGGQIAKGLFGAFIVRPARDPIPAGVTERILILSDNRFTASGAVDIADPHSAQGETDEENGREGNVLLVNGHVMPTLTIRSGEVQRWRVINASAARVYRLAIPGTTFTYVGSDGGLFEHPVERSELTLANSERAEVLVRGTAAPGTRTTLRALPYDRYVPQTRPDDWNVPRELLTLQYADAPSRTTVVIPTTLRVVPPLDTAAATATHVIVLSQGLINGRTMAMDRVDVSAPLGATEIWELENVVGLDHPFHLHGFQFQVLDRDGVPEPFRSWKDVVNVPRHQTVRIIVRYDDFAGKWMFHCHILDHEDHGMMGILEVRPPPPRGPPP